MTTPIEWPEPVLSVPFASQTMKVYQGDYYNADQVLKLIGKYNDLVAADRKCIADLERELAEARRDAERLDWVERALSMGYMTLTANVRVGEDHWITWRSDNLHGQSIRQFLDQCIEATPAERAE